MAQSKVDRSSNPQGHGPKPMSLCKGFARALGSTRRAGTSSDSIRRAEWARKDAHGLDPCTVGRSIQLAGAKAAATVATDSAAAAAARRASIDLWPQKMGSAIPAIPGIPAIYAFLPR
ncbi:MAG: hypothetical protein ACPIOQ_45425, partial [Promethearchaeia archaeon]